MIEHLKKSGWIYFVVAGIIGFWWLVVIASAADKDRQLERDQLLIECVERTNDKEWCLEVVQ